VIPAISKCSSGWSRAQLKKLAPVAEDAGIVLGLELSLTTDEYVKLLRLVDHPPSVRIGTPSPHASPEACIEETKKNIARVMRNQG
jgi:hypothetical protein